MEKLRVDPWRLRNGWPADWWRARSPPYDLTSTSPPIKGSLGYRGVNQSLSESLLDNMDVQTISQVSFISFAQLALQFRCSLWDFELKLFLLLFFHLKRFRIRGPLRLRLPLRLLLWLLHCRWRWATRSILISSVARVTASTTWWKKPEREFIFRIAIESPAIRRATSS